jgi:hypothetical protein
MEISLLTFLLILGLTARVSRLVVADLIMHPVRAWLYDLGQDGSKVGGFLSDLSSCVACTSVWVGAAATYVGYNWGDSPWFWAPALAASVSYLTIIADEVSDRIAGN